MYVCIPIYNVDLINLVLKFNFYQFLCTKKMFIACIICNRQIDRDEPLRLNHTK